MDNYDLIVITGLSLASSWTYRLVGVTVPDLIVPHQNYKEHTMATYVVWDD
jgi:hypothetical protein